MRFPALLSLFAVVIPAFAAKVDFAREVQPIFASRCTGCHGEKLHLAGLRLDERDSARRVISAGHGADSRLVAMVKGSTGKTMPPMGAKLTDAQIATLTRWIDEGAEWPASLSAARHWAWEPVREPENSGGLSGQTTRRKGRYDVEATVCGASTGAPL